jgi:hypothetical protein
VIEETTKTNVPNVSEWFEYFIRVIRLFNHSRYS